MAEYIDDYDFSDYPKVHHLYNTRHKKVLGKFKGELKGMTLEEFIGLRPKCYSLLFLGEVRNNQIIHTDAAEKQTAGVKKTYLRQNHYKDTLNNLSIVRVKQNANKSKQHKIGTYHQNKLALTAFDTTRWIREYGINTLAHGHYETKAEDDINWGEPLDIYCEWDEPIHLL